MEGNIVKVLSLHLIDSLNSCSCHICISICFHECSFFFLFIQRAIVRIISCSHQPPKPGIIRQNQRLSLYYFLWHLQLLWPLDRVLFFHIYWLVHFIVSYFRHWSSIDKLAFYFRSSLKSSLEIVTFSFSHVSTQHCRRISSADCWHCWQVLIKVPVQGMTK